MFEFLLVEWHTTPDYIANNWTHELLDLMIIKLAERKKRERDAAQGRNKSGDNEVPDTEMFAQAGNLIKVRKG